MADLGPAVDRPSAVVLAAGTGIVHLGIGAFHRAHQAVYTEDAINRAGGNWRILGVSLRGAAVRDRMRKQNHLYSVTERSGGGDRARIIGVVGAVLFAPENPGAVIAAIADRKIHVVSLTVTEKGYNQDPASGSLLSEGADIKNDLDLTNPPKTAIGYLVRGLAARRQAAAGPLNVISCDNLPDNGRVLEGLVLEFCDLAVPDLAGWIKTNVAFPCTMVDRIVPAASDEALQLVANNLGLADDLALLTEPFKQWVIEDKFVAPRPAWEQVGAQIVDNVAAFEALKLRLLNGSHSTIAYLGYLAGFETVSDAVAVPQFKTFVRQLMDEEATPTLQIPPGFDVAGYKDQLLERFSNPTLAHKTWQIAMDGSQKLPQRLLHMLYQNIRSGGATGATALAVAAWMQYVGARDEAGQPIEVSDPLAETFKQIHDKADGDAKKIVDGFLALKAIFGDPQGQPAGLDFLLFDALSQLRAHGAMDCITNYC